MARTAKPWGLEGQMLGEDDIQGAGARVLCSEGGLEKVEGEGRVT